MRRHIVKIAPTGFFADYGCHVRILEETRMLQNQGYDVTILTYPGGEDPPDTRIIRVPSWVHHGRTRVGSHWNKLFLDPALMMTALARTATSTIDVVHAHLHEGVLIGWPIARMHRAGLVFDYQGSLTREMLDHQFIDEQSHALIAFRRLEKLANHLADRIITSSENARDSLITNYDVEPDHVVAVTDGVNLQRFRPRHPKDEKRLTELRRRFQIPSGRLIVGYLGLLAEYQGTGDLILAARSVVNKLPDTHFLVMGFPNVTAYRSAAEAAGLSSHMTFTGRIDYADAPDALRLVDLAVAPKRSETEGNGKVLNYMATGLPTIAYDGSVARELLGNKGCRVPVGSVEALALAIERYVSDARLRRSEGHALRTRVEQEYGWQRQIKRIEDVYQSLWKPN